MSTVLQKLNAKYRFFDADFQYNLQPLLEMACLITGAAQSYLSVFDEEKQYFVSKRGLVEEQIPREMSVCSLTLLESGLVVIEDLKEGKHPIIQKYQGRYLGFPISDETGTNIGTFCVSDSQPGKITDVQKRMMRLLGEQVRRFLDRRRRLFYFYNEWKKQLYLNQEEKDKLETTKSMLSHDLRGPIGNLVNITKLLQERIDDPQEVRDLVGVLQINGSRIYEILDDLLSDLKKEKATKTDAEETVDLNDLVNSIESFNDFNSRFGEYRISHSKLPVIKGSRTDYFLIIQNLIENALKYSDKDTKKVDISMLRMGESTIIRVQDDGPGVDQKDAELIFSKGYRAAEDQHTEGEGFGLYNVRRILQKTNQKIWLESTEHGSSFLFTVTPISR